MIFFFNEMLAISPSRFKKALIGSEVGLGKESPGERLISVKHLIAFKSNLMFKCQVVVVINTVYKIE